MAKTNGKPSKPKKDVKAKGKDKPVARKPGPRSQALPGMESKIQVALRNVCEALGEIRDKKNGLAKEEKTEIGRGLKLMREHGREVVKWAGIELVFVKGDDKLRVRLIHDGGDGESEDEVDPVPSNQADGPGDPEPFNLPADHDDRGVDTTDL